MSLFVFMENCAVVLDRETLFIHLFPFYYFVVSAFKLFFPSYLQFYISFIWIFEISNMFTYFQSYYSLSLIALLYFLFFTSYLSDFCKLMFITLSPTLTNYISLYSGQALSSDQQQYTARSFPWFLTMRTQSPKNPCRPLNKFILPTSFVFYVILLTNKVLYVIFLFFGCYFTFSYTCFAYVIKQEYFYFRLYSYLLSSFSILQQDFVQVMPFYSFSEQLEVQSFELPVLEGQNTQSFYLIQSNQSER